MQWVTVYIRSWGSACWTQGCTATLGTDCKNISATSYSLSVTLICILGDLCRSPQRAGLESWSLGVPIWSCRHFIDNTPSLHLLSFKFSILKIVIPNTKCQRHCKLGHSVWGEPSKVCVVQEAAPPEIRYQMSRSSWWTGRVEILIKIQCFYIQDKFHIHAWNLQHSVSFFSARDTSTMRTWPAEDTKQTLPSWWTHLHRFESRGK